LDFQTRFGIWNCDLAQDLCLGRQVVTCRLALDLLK
jgi:hypothetical protein